MYTTDDRGIRGQFRPLRQVPRKRQALRLSGEASEIRGQRSEDRSKEREAEEGEVSRSLCLGGLAVGRECIAEGVMQLPKKK
jgi:hypothetical protein